MLVMGKIKLIKDFQEWKKMVQDSGDKIKEYGMTFVLAGVQANDPTILHTIIHFESMEHLKKFQADEELTQKRIDAGVKVETGTFTPVSDAALVNFPSVITQHE